jgi:hypothetical protein
MTDHQNQQQGHEVRIYGASDDLIEFDGAIHGEASWYSDHPAKITVKAPDGTKMRLTAQFCGPANEDGWSVQVVDNPGGWAVEPLITGHPDDGEPDFGVKLHVPAGVTAKCNGEKVR